VNHHRDFVLLLACVVEKYRGVAEVGSLEKIVKENSIDGEIGK
jgi:hypothetical protein